VNLWKCPDCGHVNAARHRWELPNDCGDCDAELGSGDPGISPDWDRVEGVTT